MSAMLSNIETLVKIKIFFDLTINKLLVTIKALSSGGIRRKIALCCNVRSKCNNDRECRLSVMGGVLLRNQKEIEEKTS